MWLTPLGKLGDTQLSVSLYNLCFSVVQNYIIYTVSNEMFSCKLYFYPMLYFCYYLWLVNEANNELYLLTVTQKTWPNDLLVTEQFYSFLNT